ncbi:MAG: hypothetical protein M0D57_14505 [Sphingobacteriales bacterium JAD_PAG50586_3]|nr:MAG: hypothetical protein M0D57_14505 [Sphingobacteriales bacterium JAD_PAG50586_3]
MKRFIITLLLILASKMFYAQVYPNGATFSGIARTNFGSILANEYISVRLSYLSNLSPDIVQYREVHQNVTTNIFGEFYIIAGEGTYLDGLVTDIEDIPWTSSPVYLKVEIDYNNGFVDMGAIKLWSSYYAFAANKASDLSINGQNGQILMYNNGAWTAANAPQISYDGSTGSVALSNNGGNYTTPTAQYVNAYSETTQTGTTRNTWIEDASMQLTITTAGTYMVNASGRAWGLQPGEYATFRLYNATTSTVIGQAVINGGGNDATGSFSTIVTLAANDVVKIEFRVLPGSGNTQPFSFSGNAEGASSYTIVRVK